MFVPVFLLLTKTKIFRFSSDKLGNRYAVVLFRQMSSSVCWFAGEFFASLSLHYRVRDLTSYDVKFCLARLPVSIFGTVSGGHGGERLGAEFLDLFFSFSLRIRCEFRRSSSFRYAHMS